MQREIVAETLVTAGYIGSRSSSLFKQRDLNPVTGRTLADGTIVYGVARGAVAGITPNGRINPSFSVLNTGTSFATSNYHSLQTSVNRRFYRNVQAQVSYAFAKCRDLSSGNFGGEGARRRPIRAIRSATSARADSAGRTHVSRQRRRGTAASTGINGSRAGR